MSTEAPPSEVERPVLSPAALGACPSSSAVAAAVPAMEDADRQPNLGRRIVSPHTILSFAFAIAILVFVLRRLDINPAAIWAQVQRANPVYLGGAFILWYGAFFVRAWRWGRMIDTAGAAGAHDS